MKKELYLAAFLFLLAAVSQAQITKGKTFIGGTVAYSTGETKTIMPSTGGYTQNSVVINPVLGKIVKENVVLGIQASYLNQKYKTESADLENKARSYGGGVFARRYVPLLKSFYFFGQAAANISAITTANEQINYVNNGKGWNAGLTLYPGLAYAVTKVFHIEVGLNELAAINYNRQKTEAGDPATGLTTLRSSSFGISTNLVGSAGLNFGFRLLL